jgi:cytosine/adenosine deaminase-related metal-dependent hydrolase
MHIHRLTLLTMLSVPAALDGQQVTRAIVGATLWDGNGAPAVTDATVLVDGNRIRCAGPRATCPVPAGAEVIQAQGKFLLPGLIDTHVHLLFRVAGVTDARINTDLHDLLARGITTLRDMGNDPARLLDAVDSARPAPRVVAMQLVAGAQFFLPETERSADGNLQNHAPAAIGMKQLGWWPILFTRSGDPQSIIREARAAGAIGLKLYIGPRFGAGRCPGDGCPRCGDAGVGPRLGATR